MDKTKDVFKNAFDCGIKRAKKQISQTKEIRDIAERIRKEERIREVEMEIYQLLQKAKTPSQQKKVLEAYVNGLDEVDKQGRLEYEIVWSRNKKDVEGNNIWEVILNQENSQIIVTTFAEKPRNVYCYDLKTGKRNWVYKIRYEQAFSPILGKDAFFFIPAKDHDSPSWSGDYVHAISLKTGELIWKVKPGQNAERILGLFDNLLLVYGWLGKTRNDGIMVLNAINGEEKWDFGCYNRITKFYFEIDEIILLKTGDRKIAWFSKDGEFLKEKTFGFKGFKDNAFIDLIEQDENNLYVFVWDIGSKYALDPKDRNKMNETLVVYCLGKYKKTLKWQIRIPEMRVEQMISQDNKLYMFSKEQRVVVVDKKRGKVIDEINYQGKAIKQNLLFCAGPEDKDDDSFDFYAIDLLGKKVKWQRKNFSFLALHQDLLYGRVENDLVVLNQNNGKERVKIKIDGSIHKIHFIDDKHLLVHGSNSICLIGQK